jgi:hypothetical protein
MRKLWHLLLFWGFLGSDHFAHAQLVKAYQYDFESPIISMSAKDYSIYVQQEKGIFNLLDTEVFAGQLVEVRQPYSKLIGLGGAAFSLSPGFGREPKTLKVFAQFAFGRF